MIYAGTIIEITNNKTYVFTMDYNVIAIKTKKEYILGQQITFTKKDKYSDLYLLKSGALKALALTAAAVVIVTAMAFAGILDRFIPGHFDETCTALVSVDINPSIEIRINKDEQIVDVNAMNEDGIKVVNSLDLRKKTLSEGVNEIVDTARAMGYIDESKNVVLVSAALFENKETNSNSYASKLKEILGTLEGAKDDATVLTVFVEDSNIIEEAKSNQLSIGKELLYQYAKSQEGNLTADDIRNASVNELLDKLDAIEQDGKLIETIKNPSASDGSNEGALSQELSPTPPILSEAPAPSVTQQPSATPEAEPTVTPEISDTDHSSQPTPTPKPTATPKPTLKPEVEDFKPALSVATEGDTIHFSWTTLPSGNVTYGNKVYKGFLYYKVVASADNEHPIYPDDGYLAVISDRTSSDWSVTPSEGYYNQSPVLESGEAYYFSITYVFENGKFTSNTETLKVPNYEEDVPIDSVSSLELSVTGSDNDLVFEWTPIDGSSLNYNGKLYKGFYYYKVVASETNKNPKYPEDGYLTFLSDYTESSWIVNPSEDGYNYSPELISGHTYYFSITYVFENGKVSSNTVKYTVP